MTEEITSKESCNEDISYSIRVGMLKNLLKAKLIEHEKYDVLNISFIWLFWVDSQDSNMAFFGLKSEQY